MDGKSSTDVVTALSAVAEHLFELAVEDVLLRTRLRVAAMAILDATDPVRSTEQVSSGEVVVCVAEDIREITADPPVENQCQAVAPATNNALNADAETATDDSRQPRLTTTDADLPVIEAHCRLKAEATRWAITRQRRLDEGVRFREEIEPSDKEIIAKAKAPEGCYLWMSRSPIHVGDIGLWHDVAACFETVADALVLVRLILSDRPRSQDTFERSLILLAEAQSALRCAVGLVGGSTDSDQMSIHSWLRTTTSQEKIHIRRFMRADDPADSDTWPDIAVRIESLRSEIEQAQQRRRQQEGQFRRIEYHLKPIRAGIGTDHDWHIVAIAFDELVRDGLPPSNIELRDLLLPVLDNMPDLDEAPGGFQRVLQEIERFLASRPIEPESIPQQPSAEIRQAARILNGRSALLIGGLARPAAKQALEDALGLKELIWFETREHESPTIFEPYIARPDVAVVILAIRWSSHIYGELKKVCQKYGKIFVRLPGGYNPNQVAHQIVQQAGGRVETR